MKFSGILQNKFKFHFIGIGGIGMSALAKVLVQSGFLVTGSDRKKSSLTEDLEKLGITIQEGDFSSDIEESDVVIISSAISVKHPEYDWALEKKKIILKRSQLLKEIEQQYQSISVVGSHGKTTTSSLLSWIMNQGEEKTSFIVGGIVKGLETQSFICNSKYLVFEADESDGSFTLYHPSVLVLTNLDNDHMDFYRNLDGLIESFQKYLDGLASETTIIYNKSDKNLNRLNFSKFFNVLTFGLEKTNDLHLVDYSNSSQVMNIKMGFNKEELELSTFLYGKYNIENIMAAFLVCHYLKLPVDLIKEGIKSFIGAGRRIEKLYQDKNVTIIDDYAHHPTEIKATLKGIRESFEGKYIKVYFQPHRYTRTKECWQDYLNSFYDCDEIHLLEIYSAGENEIEGINSTKLSQEINQREKKEKAFFCKDISSHVIFESERGLVLVFMGAGSISAQIRGIVSEQRNS